METEPISGSTAAGDDADRGAQQVAPRRSMRDPEDFVTALRICDRLVDAAEMASPEAVAAYLVGEHGWERPEAEEVGFVWVVVGGLRRLQARRELAREEMEASPR